MDSQRMRLLVATDDGQVGWREVPVRLPAAVRPWALLPPVSVTDRPADDRLQSARLVAVEKMDGARPARLSWGVGA